MSTVETKENQNNSRAIKVESCTLEELFRAGENAIGELMIKGKISIPEYQRPYLWGEAEVKKLVEELEEYFKTAEKKEDGKADEAKPMYYLGSIILHQSVELLNVIDGQQRLTTMALLMAVQKLERPEMQIPEISYSSPTTLRNIRANYKYLQGLKEEIRKIKIHEIHVTLVVTESEDDAYTFFETQNTGGVRLKGIDIIKAHHLRAIDSNDRQNAYARKWEAMHDPNHVIECLIKARWWNKLSWKDVPSDWDEREIKKSIIKAFSEWTLKKGEKAGYQQVQLIEGYQTLRLQGMRFAIRQPLVDGENFIDYFEDFYLMYQRLFVNEGDTDIPEDYYSFRKGMIDNPDGTAFLQELWQVAMLCYVSKFGVKDIVEAGYWIFRSSYALRVSQGRVMERSIPKYVKEQHHLLDYILSEFSHETIMRKLQRSLKRAWDDKPYIEAKTDQSGTNVNARFIKRTSEYFKKDKEWQGDWKYDEQLVKAIEGRVRDGK